MRWSDKGEFPFVTFSPDSRWLATGARSSRSVCIRETATGREALALTGHSKGVGAAAFSPDGRRLATASNDTTILIWNLAGRLNPTAAELPALEREALWDALADREPSKAQRALGSLTVAGDSGVSFLKGRVKPARLNPASVARTRQWIGELDSDAFAERERASESLREMGELAEPLLRDVLKAHPTAEVRKRVRALLAGLDSGQLPGGRLRELRAVEVLERVGTDEAKRLLTVLANGTPDARLTREAKAALERLARDPSPR
jgi:hypothetical protein